MNENIEPEVSRQVIEMITVANDFCMFAEAVEKYTLPDVLSYLQKVCPLMYIKGSLLPYVKVNTPEANERFVTEENWQAVFIEIQKKFLKQDVFYAINLDDKTETTPMKYSIAEFVADVYQDMKDFLLLYQKNTKAARENAVAECSNLFESHWGWRIIDIQKAINFILYKNRIERIDGVI